MRVNRMSPEPFNPYAPPQAVDRAIGSRGPRWRWGEFGFRAFAVVAGFSLVADPTSAPGVDSAMARAVGGIILARGVGLALLALAFLPWRPARRLAAPANSGDREEEVEEL